MAKSKRSVNPADAMRKAQRKRELKKNKEIRKTAREATLAKKDTGHLQSEISKLEALAEQRGALEPPLNAKLKKLRDEMSRIEKAKKDTAKPLSKAQEALEARRRQQQESESAESRKLVFDAKSGKFVPVKGKDADKDAQGASHDEDEDDSGSEDDSDLESDDELAIEGMDVVEDEETEELPASGAADAVAPPLQGKGSDIDEDDDAQDAEIPLPADSDEDIDIPLPPGPPPHQPFRDQLPSVRPPPPPPPRSAAHYPRPPRPYGMAPYQHAPTYSARPPPPPPPRPYGARPYHRPPPRPLPPAHAAALAASASVSAAPVMTPPRPNAAISKETSATATISAEPQLRDLQKELVGFVPAALRRKQTKAKQQDQLPKGARADKVNLAPDVE
ncbi:WW domain binding protein 11-domain-containing protein [Gongronella butleri]|nr:WW domain binding protein 11-domain-containing protein [Gongronella butleri]